MEIRRLEEQGMTRNVLVQRNTKETKITMSLNLDGTGKASLNTGIGFFDHMLDGFARHGFFDLDLAVDGDLNVDSHHTIEDTGIVLGTAIKEALGDSPLWKHDSSHGRDTGTLRHRSVRSPVSEL